MYTALGFRKSIKIVPAFYRKKVPGIFIYIFPADFLQMIIGERLL